MTTSAPSATRGSKAVAQTEGDDQPGTRAAIIGATMEVMREEGYAAVTSRKVAQRAGLKSKLVHYYFRTMDDLFLAVFRSYEDKYFEAQAKALASSRPLRELWEMSTDSSNTKIVGELVALANHRKSIRNEIARSSERSRKLQAAIVEKAFNDAGIAAGPFPPILVSLIITAISRLLAMDDVLGVAAGHPETARFIEDMLQRIEAGEAPSPLRRDGKPGNQPP